MEEELRLSEQQVHDKDLIIEEKARSIAELNQKVEWHTYLSHCNKLITILLYRVLKFRELLLSCIDQIP